MEAITQISESRDDILDRPDWRTALNEAIRNPTELCRILGLDPALGAEAQAASDDRPLLVTRPYLARIRRGDPTDPLLLQVLPQAVENGVYARLFERSAR